MNTENSITSKVENFLSDGYFSHYCSLIEEDGIEKVVVEYNAAQLKDIGEKISNAVPDLSGKVEIGHLVYVTYLNAKGEEVSPEFHDEPVVELGFTGKNLLADGYNGLNGIIMVSSYSCHDDADTAEVTFKI